MKDRISQLMDGELDERAAASAVDSLAAEGEARDTWRTYHLISDAMRDTPLLSAGFGARLAEKLAAQPTVLAPNRIRAPARSWFAMPAAAAASFAALALVGWLAFAPQGQAPLPAPIAQVQPEARAEVRTVAAKPQNIPLPSATPDYLLAHQGFSPRVSLQGMAPYARTVSDHAAGARK
jgi:sigma-E factor negative regulatory protein RseA